MLIPRNIVRRAQGSQVAGTDRLNPVISRVLSNRNVESIEELAFSSRDLLLPDGLGGVIKAAGLICDHVSRGSRILIVGDYDADGATSCALGILVLRALGAQVDYLVPDRFRFGYGLSAPLVEVAAQMSPKLMITVDNGISSIEGARRARELGIGLVITDHHLPGAELPEADAIVNPNLLGDAFASKNLAGVGVLFYVLSVVRRLLDERGWFRSGGRRQPILSNYLDLVALGTYADLVKLDRNNRILVAQGMKRINAGRCRPGIRALVEISGRSFGSLVAADLGFQLAPRLNAAGRLEDMALGIECLIEDDPARARQLAERLDSINQERKEREKQMQHQAVVSIKLETATDEQGICVFNEEWHEGIIGLVASRLKERRGLPAIAFARGEDGDLKGSARSVPGVHIRDVLCAIDAREPGLLIRFGGHAMAAGMTISGMAYEPFRAAFMAILNDHQEQIVAARRLLTDGPLHDEFDDLAFIRQLKTLAPWGQGFPEPLFDNRFRVLHQQLVGDVHLKLILQPEKLRLRVEAICFRFLEARGAPCPVLDWIHAAYRLDINEFSGRIRPQLIVEHLEAVEIGMKTDAGAH